MSAEDDPDLIEVCAYKREPPPRRVDVYEVHDSDSDDTDREDGDNSSSQSSDDCIVELHKHLKTKPHFRMQQRPLLKSLAQCHVACDPSEEVDGARSGNQAAFKLVTWNIDGLNDKSIQSRILFVCNTINRLVPDVVFLQEVVPSIVEAVKKYLPRYTYIPGDVQGYFAATLMNKQSVKCINHSIVPFTSTKMDRHIVCAEVTFNGSSLLLMNTHLESMAYSSGVRSNQLRKCFRRCMKEPSDKTVIFGGDLNLRDSELASVGGIPEGMIDVWEACGSNPATCHTWDMSINDNLEFGDGRAKPKCRFDRVYVRHSQPPRLVPVSFELVGLSRLSPEGCFPSDHWGLVCCFHHR
ncbi:unnamed protein product [Ixodes hexagonus]